MSREKKDFLDGVKFAGATLSFSVGLITALFGLDGLDAVDWLDEDMSEYRIDGSDSMQNDINNTYILYSGLFTSAASLAIMGKIFFNIPTRRETA